ncbi:MAG: cupin domain-containing protein [Betaproteobacteria bacterium]|nr:cupin domain-containing protein [Betaproteobacteria bacterium]
MRFHQTLCAAALASVTVLVPISAVAHEFVDNGKVTPLLSEVLAAMPGKVGTMLTVEYPPGGKTDKHRHPGAYTFVYVLEGELEFQVEGKAAAKLTAGQTYFETPDDVHSVSRNLSETKPARFLVVFIQEQGKPPVEPVP